MTQNKFTVPELKEDLWFPSVILKGKEHERFDMAKKVVSVERS